MNRWAIDGRFEIAANAGVLEFLRRTMPSAHSDVAEALYRSADGLAGVFYYCPDRRRDAFVLLHLADFSIIGLAYGQSSLAYRLPHESIQRAIEDGGSAAPELGSRWVYFAPWSNDEPLARSWQRLALWCSVAARAVPRTTCLERGI